MCIYVSPFPYKDVHEFTTFCAIPHQVNAFVLFVITTSFKYMQICWTYVALCAQDVDVIYLKANNTFNLSLRPYEKFCMPYLKKKMLPNFHGY